MKHILLVMLFLISVSLLSANESVAWDEIQIFKNENMKDLLEKSLNDYIKFYPEGEHIEDVKTLLKEFFEVENDTQNELFISSREYESVYGDFTVHKMQIYKYYYRDRSFRIYLKRQELDDGNLLSPSVNIEYIGKKWIFMGDLVTIETSERLITHGDNDPDREVNDDGTVSEKIKFSLTDSEFLEMVNSDSLRIQFSGLLMKLNPDDFKFFKEYFEK